MVQVIVNEYKQITYAFIIGPALRCWTNLHHTILNTQKGVIVVLYILGKSNF